MAFAVFVAILAQGTLSQNSTHVINVEGIRLKNALQVYIEVNRLYWTSYYYYYYYIHKIINKSLIQF